LSLIYRKEHEDSKLEWLLPILCTQKVTLRVFFTEDSPLKTDSHVACRAHAMSLRI